MTVSISVHTGVKRRTLWTATIKINNKTDESCQDDMQYVQGHVSKRIPCCFQSQTMLMKHSICTLLQCHYTVWVKAWTALERTEIKRQTITRIQGLSMWSRYIHYFDKMVNQWSSVSVLCCQYVEMRSTCADYRNVVRRSIWRWMKREGNCESQTERVT